MQAGVVGRELVAVEELHALHALQEYAGIEALPLRPQVEAVGELGHGAAAVHPVVVVNLAVAVHVLESQVAGLGVGLNAPAVGTGVAGRFLVRLKQALRRDEVVGIQRLAHRGAVGVELRPHVVVVLNVGAAVAVQVLHGVLEGGHVAAGLVGEGTHLPVVAQAQLQALVEHGAHVGGGAFAHARAGVGGNGHNQPAGVLAEVVYAECQAAVEHAQVQAGVEGFGPFPLQVRVRLLVHVVAGVVARRAAQVRLPRHQRHVIGVVVHRLDVANLAPRGPQLEQLHGAQPKKRLRRDFPGPRKRREVVGVVRGQARSLVAAAAGRQEVAVGEAVGEAADGRREGVLVHAARGLGHELLGVAQVLVPVVFPVEILPLHRRILVAGALRRIHGREVEGVLAQGFLVAGLVVPNPLGAAGVALGEVVHGVGAARLRHARVEALVVVAQQVEAEAAAQFQAGQRRILHVANAVEVEHRVADAGPQQQRHRVVHVAVGPGKLKRRVGCERRHTPEFAVGVAHRRGRRHVDGVDDAARVAVARVGAPGVGLVHVQVLAYRHLVAQVVVGFEAQGVAFQLGAQQQALVVEVAKRGEVAAVFAAAAHRGVEVVDAGRAENLVHPVGARHLAPRVFGSVVGGQAGHAGVVGGLVVGGGLLGGIQRLGPLVGRLPALVRVERDAGRAVFAAPGGHHNHARGRLGPVNGGRRRVLQHGHAGNVVGVQRAAVVGHAVHHVQRRLAVGRARAANHHPGRGRGVAAILQHRHAGHVALQHVLHAGDGAVGLLLGVG